MKKVLRFFVSNYRSLLASMSIAVILWATIITDRVYVTRIEAPLHIKRLATNRVLLNPPPVKAILDVEGKGRALIALNFFPTSIDLELPDIDHSTTLNLNEYKNQFKIGREIGIEIVDIIEPKTIDLQVDRFFEDWKPIKLHGQVKPLAGYILTGSELSQDSVLVSGPRSLIKMMNYIYCDSINFQNAKYPFETEVRLLNPKIGVLQLNPQIIKVKYHIEQLVERTIYNIPIQLTGVPVDLIAAASPATITIRVKGGESVVSNVTPLQISTVFDYNKDYQKGQLYFPVRVRTPENVTLLEISPKNFRLQLKRIAE